MGLPKVITDTILAQAYQQRIVLLLDSVNGDSQTYATQSFIGLNLAGEEPITLLIDSVGGNSVFGDWIGDAIRCSKAPVNGLVVGSAYSAAFRILQSCQLRLAWPHARLMMHGFRFDSLRTDQANFQRMISQAKQIHSETMEMVARRSGQTVQRCRSWSRQERNFPATEALVLGLIDEIVQPKPLLEVGVAS